MSRVDFQGKVTEDGALLSVFMTYFKALRRQQESPTKDGLKALRKAMRKMDAFDSKENLKNRLVAAGLITTEKNCSTCSDCWLPTQLANQLLLTH